MSEVISELENGVASLCWNRPEAMNALTPTMLQIAGDAIGDWAKDASVRVIVISGEGKAFSAGVDLKALGKIELHNGSVGEILDAPARRLIDAIEQAPQPVIAKVNGHCYTGALELALACDLLICADQAGFGDTHAKWGIRPSWGMSQRLAQRVGSQRARELSMTARTVKGPEAAAIGLALESHPREQLDARVEAVVSGIVENCAQALAAYKDLYRRTQGSSLDEGLAYEFAREYPLNDSMNRLAGFLSR